MKIVMKDIAAIEARTPSRIESRPSEAPTVSSCRYLSEAGRAPALRIFESSSASWVVKRPVMRLSAPSLAWITGAE